MVWHPMQQYRPWRFLVLLATLILLLVIQPMVQGFSSPRPVFDVLTSLVLLAAILSLFSGRGPTRLALVFGVPALAGRWLAFMFSANGDDFVALADYFVEILFLGFVAVMILRTILTQGRISSDSIFGAICAYLIFGMAWGSLYSVIEIRNPGSFHSSGELAAALQSVETRGPVLTYYSFVTLTTTGYGDITPVAPTARTLAWLEAMTGQFYIAVLVAGLVGIRVSQGPGNRNDKPSSRHP